MDYIKAGIPDGYDSLQMKSKGGSEYLVIYQWVSPTEIAAKVFDLIQNGDEGIVNLVSDYEGRCVSCYHKDEEHIRQAIEDEWPWLFG